VDKYHKLPLRKDAILKAQKLLYLQITGKNGFEPDFFFCMNFTFFTCEGVCIFISPETSQSFGCKTTTVIVSNVSGAGIKNSFANRV
jgi:hypothetical protein